MPPKAATKKAAAPKATAAAAKKAAPAAASKKAAAPKKAAAAPASKKRKASDEDEDDAAGENKENLPKSKKAKTETAPKKAAATKAKAEPKKATAAASKTEKKAPAPKKAAAATTKRGKAESDAEDDTKTPAALKAKKAKVVKPKRVAAPRPIVAPKHPHTIGSAINPIPTQVLDVFVFGEGTSGELGLGNRKLDGKKPVDVKRPRLNANLDPKTVGVVQMSCGGMHVVALTRDNKILTWGVNDQGALGRDTTWDGGLRDMNDDGSDSEDEAEGFTEMNPLESTPKAVSADHFAPGTKFVQVVASDSATFALTEDGRVYGWGTFRASDGILGFFQDKENKTEPLPQFIPDLKKIRSLAAGANHILALDTTGHVWAWGCGQQNQLGRRIFERNPKSSLTPQGLGLPKKNIEKIACGQYHSFAIDDKGKVWAWGLNSFGGTGIRDNAGEDEAVILRPLLVEALDDHKIVDIAGGQHHSVACTEEGKLLSWGRFDGFQTGFEAEDLDEDSLIRDEHGRVRILAQPTPLPVSDKVVKVAASTDNSFAITSDGKAYSWGFSANYQTGQGTADDVKKPTHIDNSAVREKQLIWAGAGGQYSVLCATSDAK